jgi:hypothetical protein
MGEAKSMNEVRSAKIIFVTKPEGKPLGEAWADNIKEALKT